MVGFTDNDFTNQKTKDDDTMELDLFWIGLGIAAFGYFIGEGMKNFKKGSTSNNLLDLEDDHELLKESDLHWFMGVSKEDAKQLIAEHPDVPHLRLNGTTYYPRKKLKKWLLTIGDTKDQ